VRNANDCLSVGQIADGALGEITNLLTRSVTLAEEAATETVDSTGRAALNAEFTQIEAEIARIANQTNFGGVNLFTTGGMNGDLSVFVGDIFWLQFHCGYDPDHHGGYRRLGQSFGNPKFNHHRSDNSGWRSVRSWSNSASFDRCGQ